MKTTKLRDKVFTYEDFCVRIKENQKADLIDGVIFMASPENIDANDLGGWLYTLLRIFVRRRKAGKVYHSRVACRLDDNNAPEPDIFFVRNEKLNSLEWGGLRGSPDLAIEVVSPDSVERDYDKKRKQYEEFDIREYWIVDEVLQEVTLLRLNKKGKYREISPKKEFLESEVLVGFRLRPEWLWQEPLPDELETLALLLGE